MRTNAIACRTSIRRFKRANYLYYLDLARHVATRRYVYQLIHQLNFVTNKFLKENKKVPVPTRDRITGALREYSTGRLKHLLVL